MVNLVAYDTKGQRLPPITLDQISDVLEQPDTFVWMGLHEPDEALLEKLQEEFGLHDLADRGRPQRPSAPEDRRLRRLAVHRPAHRAGGEPPLRVRRDPRFPRPALPGHDPPRASLSYAPVRARVEREPELLALGPSYCFYAVFDFIVDNYMPIVEAFQSELHALETAIFEHEFNRDIVERLYDLKRELITLRLAIAPAQDISNQLMRVVPDLIRDEVRPYLRDVTITWCGSRNFRRDERDGVGRGDVNVAMVSVGQGEVVKRLAGWAALLAAPTLIASWYGMNFRHMPELAWRYSYSSCRRHAWCASAFIACSSGPTGSSARARTPGGPRNGVTKFRCDSCHPLGERRAMNTRPSILVHSQRPDRPAAPGTSFDCRPAFPSCSRLAAAGAPAGEAPPARLADTGL